MKTLDALQVGERTHIVDVAGDDAVATRLQEMGLIEGTEIELLGAAPLGDPLEFLIRGYRLSLRLNEAHRVFVRE